MVAPVWRMAPELKHDWMIGRDAATALLVDRNILKDWARSEVIVINQYTPKGWALYHRTAVKRLKYLLWTTPSPQREIFVPLGLLEDDL